MLISILFVLVVSALVVILTVFAILASRKNTVNKEGDKNMMKSLFYYLVLFATLMMTIGGSVSAFMAVADIVSPPPYYQSYENFKEMTRNAKYQTPDGQTEEPEAISEEELRERYDTMVEETRAQEQSRAINRLIKSLGWIVIPFPIFLYYQRRMKD